MTSMPPDPLDEDDLTPVRRITILGRDFVLPRSRLVRIVIGVLFVLFGLVGFLPIVGFWMIPVGVLILSYEFAMIRRWRRRMAVKWGRRNGRRMSSDEP